MLFFIATCDTCGMDVYVRVLDADKEHALSHGTVLCENELKWRWYTVPADVKYVRK